MTPQSRRRWVPFIGYAMLLAVLPYLVLKGLWLTGHMVGIPADSPARDEEFIAANAITALMDVAAIGLAFALTHRWGLRIPGWLVLVPAWVGAGFLVPAVAGVFAGAAAAGLTGGAEGGMSGGLVEPWVYGLVYASFAVQGILLVLAFAGYAGQRWSDLSAVRPSQAHRVLLMTGGVLAAVCGAADLVWAFGPTGPYGAYVQGWQFTSRFGTGVEGLLALAAAAGALMLCRDASRLAVRLAFFGSGTLFAYGLFRTVPVVAKMAAAETSTAWNNLVQLVALLAGLTVGVAGVLLLSAPVARSQKPL